MTVEAAEQGPLAGWRRWLGVLLSAGLLAFVAAQFGKAPLQALALLSTLGPAFWVTFALIYFAQPLFDWVIFARLWRLPPSGLGVLLRKVVLNEIVLGYSGEAYFYLWARSRTELTGAPFAAIKDVNVLSALAANALAVAMLGVSALILPGLDLLRLVEPMLWSGAAVVALSLLILLARRRVFSLGRRDLGFVASVHVARLIVVAALTVLLWRIALPEIAVSVWIVLFTIRLVVARLPFLPSKDLAFAGLAVAFGVQAKVGLLLATCAVVTLLAHLAVMGVLNCGELWRIVRRAGRPRSAVTTASQ